MSFGYELWKISSPINHGQHLFPMVLAQKKHQMAYDYRWAWESPFHSDFRMLKPSWSNLTDRVIHGSHATGHRGGSTYSPVPKARASLTIHCRLYTSLIVCYGTFVASFNSALFAGGIAQARQEFSVSNEVGILGTSLFVLGFAFGPLIWAPGSELIGRRWPLCVGMIGCSIFTIGSATAKDIQTLIICRFFAGVFGASPLCVVPAVIADIYTDVHRGVAISIYALTVFGGPLVAPFIGGFITKSYLGWRWTLYLPAIMGFLDTILLLIWLKETYHPIILTEKAVIIRRQTGNWGIHAEQEKVEIDFREVAHKYFTRPLRMLATEPIVLAVSLYMSFIYGLVYALLEAYPYVFGDIYGMDIGVDGLPFLGLLIGVLLALVYILSQQGSYVKKLAANNNQRVPEWRLQPAVPGAFAFTVGLFW